MTELIYYAATSLDGFIATPQGEVDWLEPFQNEGEDYGFAEFYGSIDGIIMGSKTYEFALGHGQWQSPDKPSWVLSRRELPIMHASITLTDDDLETVVEDMKESGCRRVWVLGGGRLAASLRDANLLTHCSFAIMPVLLGDGIPLFATSANRQSIELVDTKRYPSGVMLLDYRISR